MLRNGKNVTKPLIASIFPLQRGVNFVIQTLSVNADQCLQGLTMSMNSISCQLAYHVQLERGYKIAGTTIKAIVTNVPPEQLNQLWVPQVVRLVRLENIHQMA